MFRCTVKNKEYKFAFKHHECGTVCIIYSVNRSYDRETEEEVVNAQSYRVTGDNPCKAVGRKTSLARALRYTEWDKPTRTVVWEAYKKVCKVQ